MVSSVAGASMDFGSLQSLRSLRVVGVARLWLSLFLLAVSLIRAPSMPVRNFLLAYLVYAALFAMAMLRRRFAHRLLPWAVGFQAIDFAVATMLVYATSGADSPYFSPYMFLLVTAMLQWGSRGAMIMGAILLAAFAPTGIAAFLGDDTDRAAIPQFINRVGTVSVVLGLLVGFARHLERAIDELARLSEPTVDAANEVRPPAAACLRHALTVFGAARGAIVWSEADEPVVQLLNDANGKPILLDLGDAAIVDPALTQPAFLCDRAGRTLYRRGWRNRQGPLHALAPALSKALNFDRALAMRVRAEDFDGWLFVLDHDETANEDLAIGALVGAQASVMIERWRAQQLRREAVAGEERVRLARDLHDGVLQFLAGTALQLGTLEREEGLSEVSRRRLAMLRAALTDEQRELRGLVAALRPSRGPGAEVAEELTALADRLGRHWSIEVTATVTPTSLRASGSLMFDLTRLVREGVANAVRHGGARRVSIGVTGDGDALKLAIADDGKGFPETGRWTDADLTINGIGPRSLRERTRTLGGSLGVESAKEGSTVTIELPAQVAA